MMISIHFTKVKSLKRIRRVNSLNSCHSDLIPNYKNNDLDKIQSSKKKKNRFQIMSVPWNNPQWKFLWLLVFFLVDWDLISTCNMNITGTGSESREDRLYSATDHYAVKVLPCFVKMTHAWVLRPVNLGNRISRMNSFSSIRSPNTISNNLNINRLHHDHNPRHHSNVATARVFISTTSKTQLYNSYVQLFTENDNDGDDNPESSQWLRWMTGGTPRGVAEVKMRDPPAFGGVARSDRYASRDWLHNALSLPTSRILKSISFPVFSMTFWGAAISLLHKFLQVKGKNEMAAQLCIPTQPHSLMVSALGLLLVFRTNSAYQRFAEGRKIWEDILTVARDLSRLCKLYEPQIGTLKLRRVNRLLAAFPYLLRFRIKPNSIMRKLDDKTVERDPETSLILYQDHATLDSDQEAAAVATDEETTGMSRRKTRELYWVDKRTLPWRLLPSKAMEECARAQNRPLWVCDRLAKELHSVPDQDNWTARERLTLLSKVEKLSACISACERIHQTVVPLNYARHALRSLTFWLLSLPFALVKDLGLMTGPILFFISWLMFGVYEIGYSIEDPFQGTLRLSILCDAIRRDVLSDELIRNTAFILEKEDSYNPSPSTGATNTNAPSPMQDNQDDEDLDDEEVDDNAVEIEDILIDERGNVVSNTQREESLLNGDVSHGSSATSITTTNDSMSTSTSNATTVSSLGNTGGSPLLAPLTNNSNSARTPAAIELIR